MRFLLSLLVLMSTLATWADDGSRLWLRFPDAPSPTVSVTLDAPGASALSPADRAIVQTAVDELRSAWQGLPLTLRLGNEPSLQRDAFRIEKVLEESFLITASSPTGLLYAAYFALRAQTMGDGCLCQALGPNHEITERPQAVVRRVGIGNTALVEGRCPMLARALASVGINEVLIPDADFGTIATLADVFLPYGITLRTSSLVSDPLPLTEATAWTDSHLQQYDIYAIGRQLWQADIVPARTVCEWLAQTFSDNPYFIISMRDAMLSPAAERTKRLFDTWQEMHSYVDSQRYEEVEQWLMQQLTNDK